MSYYIHFSSPTSTTLTPHTYHPHPPHLPPSPYTLTVLLQQPAGQYLLCGDSRNWRCRLFHCWLYLRTLLVLKYSYKTLKFVKVFSLESFFFSPNPLPAFSLLGALYLSWSWSMGNTTNWRVFLVSVPTRNYQIWQGNQRIKPCCHGNQRIKPCDLIFSHFK